jgi:hypothetical protein
MRGTLAARQEELLLQGRRGKLFLFDSEEKDSAKLLQEASSKNNQIICISCTKKQYPSESGHPSLLATMRLA